MKNTAYNMPFTAALMTGLTYAAVVTAMFASLNNVAKAEPLTVDKWSVEITPWFAMAADAKGLELLPATAAGQSYTEKPALVSDGQASKLYNQVQQNVSAQLAKLLEKKFNQNLESH